MGSVMDQERPWEREEKPLDTIRRRLERAAEFGQGHQIDCIIDELVMMEEKIDELHQALSHCVKGTER